MIKGIKLCVNSQTPLLRFKTSYVALLDKYGYLDSPLDIGRLEEDIDYQITPGGVTSMIFPLLRQLMSEGTVANSYWVALGPDAPPEASGMGIQFINIDLGKRDLPRYANFKECIWNAVHGLSSSEIVPEEYQAYTRYNWLTARTLLNLLPNVDLYFIHDFQQLQVGHLIGPSAPTVFEWHIPFRVEPLSPKMRLFITKNIAGFDAMIVSTRRDLEGLIRAGYHGSAYQVYPYIDLEHWRNGPSPNIQSKVMDKFALSNDDFILLTVGRMDRVKAQDVAIRALALLKKKYPKVKLLLIGNGSFTGSAQGGLSHSKARVWLSELQNLTKELRLEESVIFAGFQPDEIVHAAYSMCDVVLVPSNIEGFNLTSIEGWINRKPIVVSQGAGSSELINEGVNGYSFPPKDHERLSRRVSKLLSNGEAASKMGESGSDTARICSIDQRLKSVKEVFEDVLTKFGS